MSLPSREWIIEQIKKNLPKRLSWLSVWAIVGLLIDEYAKEGYILNPADLTNPFAHEFWIAVLAIIGVVSAYISKKREAEDEGRS
ncbi:MAG: hypothetical protein J7J61_06970 [Candidatus Hydrothermae bacterium]|nr:hypothetical protein [Candidatus Hydrothermae bacterium]